MAQIVIVGPKNNLRPFNFWKFIYDLKMSESAKKLASELLKGGCLKTPAIVEAFQKIDRADFVPPDLKNEAYENYPLPIGYGQTISQPLTVAFMLELLFESLDAKGRSPDCYVGKKILDIGSGSGWVVAILAEIIGARGKVISVERIPELVKMAEKNVGKYNFIEKGIAEIILADGSRGAPPEFLPKGGFDKIIAAAAGKEIPEAWKRQLKIGGRIVAPVGQSIAVLDKISGKRFEEKDYFGFNFVPLIRD